LPRVEEEGGTGRQVVKSCLLVPIVGWRGEGVILFLGLVLFRLVAPPLQPGVVGSYLVWGIWFSNRLPLDGTDCIHNFGP
jgi:hypothetical protein